MKLKIPTIKYAMLKASFLPPNPFAVEITKYFFPSMPATSYSNKIYLKNF